MPIRIDCDRPDYKGAWIEFRDDRWRYGDRNKILNSVSDQDTLEIILGYVTAWNLTDVDGKKVKFEPTVTVTGTVGEGDDEKGFERTEPNLGLFDDLDEQFISWIIGAWFEAKNSRMEIPKEN
jgi:hypothetical protein